MRDDEVQLKAQRCLQEYEDAVENLDPNFADLGQQCVSALDEFISFWNQHPESPESRAKLHREAEVEGAPTEHEMRQFVERQLEWAQSEKERILTQLAQNN